MSRQQTGAPSKHTRPCDGAHVSLPATAALGSVRAECGTTSAPDGAAPIAAGSRDVASALARGVARRVASTSPGRWPCPIDVSLCCRRRRRSEQSLQEPQVEAAELACRAYDGASTSNVPAHCGDAQVACPARNRERAPSFHIAIAILSHGLLVDSEPNTKPKFNPNPNQTANLHPDLEQDHQEAGPTTAISRPRGRHIRDFSPRFSHK